MSFKKVVATMIVEVKQLRSMTMMAMITTMSVKETIAVVHLLLP
jgi:hypothetical protein